MRSVLGSGPFRRYIFFVGGGQSGVIPTVVSSRKQKTGKPRELKYLNWKGAFPIEGHAEAVWATRSGERDKFGDVAFCFVGRSNTARISF